MPNITNIPASRVPLIEDNSTLMSREWYRFFYNIFELTGGGSSDLTVNDLAQAPGSMTAEAFAEINSLYSLASSLPRPELGTMAALQQDNVPWLRFSLTSLPYTPPVGTLWWDGGTTANVQMTTNVTQPIGEAQYYYVKADAAITKGQVVMFTGAVGASGVLKAAPAQSVTIADYIMGVAAEDIALNGFGLITSFGLVKGLNTSAFSEGDVLYYDPTSVGGFTNVPPNQGATAPATSVIVAAVVSAIPGNGSVFVRVSLGSKLGASDSNVQFGPLSNGDLIQYDSASGYWKNVASSAIGTVSSISFGTTGLTPATATTGAVTVAGTLNAVNGGTGQSSYAVGDILYASSTTALDKLADVATGNALISGGVSVAPSWGKIGLTTHVSGTLGVGNGGTGSTSFTAGSIIFSDGTKLTENNAKFYWDNTNNRFGIGLGTAPSFPVQWTLTGAGTASSYGFSCAVTQSVSTAGRTVFGVGFNNFYVLDTAASGNMNSTFYQGYVNLQNSAAGTNIYSLVSRCALNGASPTGTIANWAGLYVDSVSYQQTGTPSVTITSQSGVRINNQGAVTTGVAITSSYGLRIDSQTGATVSWAIYSAGGQSAHSGNFRIGSVVAPTVALDVTGEIKASGNITSGAIVAGKYTALATGTTAMAFGVNQVVKVTPNADATYTTTIATAGSITSLIIVTSGATSYTITFGTGFKTTGTLATGTTTAKTFVLAFVSDGTTMTEISRTVAM